jgi:release factor glutamine methyltransferase
MARFIAEYIRDARARLAAAGIASDEAAIDADVLARHALGGWEEGQLLQHKLDVVSPGFPAAYETLLARREAREPTAYIVGQREFWGLDIEVTRDTLVPRPETEFLVEEMLARPPAGPARVADVCTGSGCVAIALARWLPMTDVVATDISEAALRVASRNAERNDVGDRITFVLTNLLDGLDGGFDAIVANPPYVPTAAIAETSPEVRDFEPVTALDGGIDGLDLIRRLVPAASERLVAGGWLLFEFGYGEADAVRAIIQADKALHVVGLRNDLAGIPRVAVARRTPA